MADGKKSFKDKLEFQIALRKIDSAFEACNRFEGADKKTLFEAIGNLLFQHARPDHVEAPTTSDEAPPLFSDRCLELADVAPTDEIREVLLKIADWCQAELEPKQNAASHSSQ
jgi:hypothetical protein